MDKVIVEVFGSNKSPQAEFLINGKTVSEATPAYVIAEIGSNHQGSLDKARRLFLAAKECGVDAVKLQKRNNKKLYTKEMYDRPYDNEQSFGPTYGTHRDALELGKSEYLELRAYAKSLGLEFIVTPFDFDSVDFLEEIGIDGYKVASGDLKNTPLLQYMAKTGKPIIMSTGGAFLEDVRRAHDAIMSHNKYLGILQCTAAYPVEAEDMHLNVINTFRREFPKAVIGLSDHQSGIAMAVVAYALGARILEKHFTLNRAWKGTDNIFSLEPVGMRKMVRDLRRAYSSMGMASKVSLPSEQAPLLKMSKKLVAARAIKAGEVLQREDIAIKSPGGGMQPYELNKLIGKRVMKAMAEDDAFSSEIVASEELEAWALSKEGTASTLNRPS